jgi:hypothetical protein
MRSQSTNANKLVKQNAKECSSLCICGATSQSILLGSSDGTLRRVLANLWPRHAGTKDYITRMEAVHSGYLHKLWRYAVKIKGSGATFQEFAKTMNEKSAAPAEERTALNVSSQQLANWFKKNSGKQHSSKEKPLLTKK